MSETELIRLDRYTDAAKSLVARAQELADERRHTRVEPIHLLACILQRAPALFEDVGADPAALIAAAAVELEGLARGNEDSYLSKAMLQLLRRAEREAGEGPVSVEHLVGALLLALDLLQGATSSEGDPWVEERYAELTLEPGRNDASTAERLTSLRRAYEDEGTVFGRVASSAEIEAKHVRIREMVLRWESSFDSLEGRFRAAQALSFLRGPTVEGTSDEEVAVLARAMQDALAARWPRHIHMASPSPEQRGALATLARLGAPLPPGLGELLDHVDTVWLASEDVSIGAETYAEYTRAFGNPNPALAEAAASGRGFRLLRGVDAICDQVLRGARVLVIGDGLLSGRPLRIEVAADGRVSVYDGARRSSHATLAEWLGALTADVKRSANVDAGESGLDLRRWTPAQLTPPKKWEERRSSVAKWMDGLKRAHSKSFGTLTIAGELAVWHPLDDLYDAPRLPFTEPPRVSLLTRGGELIAYVLDTAREAVRWSELGDASTDADRFFLVPVDDTEAVIDWFNDDPVTFEELGGDEHVQTVRRRDVHVVVIDSPDGVARIHAGYAADGELVRAIIDVASDTDLVRDPEPVRQ